jgi:hypothetical protein
MPKPPISDKHECWPSNEDCIVYFPIGHRDTFEDCLEAYLAVFPTVEPLATSPYKNYFAGEVRDAVRHIHRYKKVIASLYRLHQLRRDGAINLDIVEETA